MKTTSIILVLLLLRGTVFTQDLFYVKGAQMTVQGTGLLYIQGGYLADNTGGTANVANNGDIMVMSDPAAGQENWTNNGNAAMLSGNGTVTLGANGNQDITGSATTTFYNLTLDGTSTNYKNQVGVDSYVGGTLNLTNEILNTNTYRMYVNNPSVAAIQRTGTMSTPWSNSTSLGMVMSSGSGKLVRSTNSTAVYAFPVGSTAGTPRFRPVELTPLSAGAQQYGVRLVNNDADLDGLDKTDKEATLASLNPLYYHKIDRYSGTGNTDIGIYFDNVADGFVNFTKMAEWTFNDPGITPEWWEDLNDTPGDMMQIANAAPTLSAVKRFAYQYAYNTENFILEQGSNALPVELTLFNGTNEGSYNLLHWETASEVNNNYFTVEKSEDGLTFTELGRVAGAGTSSQPHSYQLADKEPFALTYYRLKQTDYNGDYTHSRIISIARSEQQATLITDLWPNPASDYLSLNIQAEEGQEITVHIWALTCEVVLAQSLGAAASGVYNNLIDVSSLANGVYYVGLKAGENHSRHKLVIAR